MGVESGSARRFGWMVAMGAGLLVVITGVYAYYTHRQLIETRDAIRHLQTSIARDQSPVIWPDSSPVEGKPKPPIVLTIDEPIEWTFHYTNFGKSPAFHIASRSVVLPAANAMKEVEAFFQDMPKRLPVSGAQAVAMPGVRGDKPVTARSKDVASPDDFNTASHEGGLYLAGRFEYESSDGTPCRSDFCRFTLLNGATQDCPTHNELHCGQ